MTPGTKITRLAMAAMAAATLAACGGSSGGGGSSGSSGAGQPTPSFNDHGTKQAGGDTIEVEADDFYFEPSVITGTPGQQITVKLSNGSGTEHNFSVDSQNVDVDIEAHDEATTTVTIPSSGFVSFYCSYHRSSGMAGLLKPAS